MADKIKSEKQLLLCRPRPYFDEHIIDYAIRLAECNGYDPRWLFRLIGLDGLQTAKLSEKIDDTIFKKIGDLTDIELSTLKSLQTEFQFPIFAQNSGLHILLDKKRNLHLLSSSLKVCPICLKHKGYVRSIWRADLVTVCPLHSVVLINKCPSCKRKLTWFRNKVGQCECSYDLRNSKIARAHEVELLIARKIYREYNLPCSHDTTINNRLASLPLEQMLSAVILIAEQYLFMEYGGKKLIFHFEKLRETIIRSVKIFYEWPTRFKEFLDEVKIFYRTRCKKRIFGISRDFGRFHARLHQRSSFHEYSTPIQAAIPLQFGPPFRCNSGTCSAAIQAGIPVQFRHF